MENYITAGLRLDAGRIKKAPSPCGRPGRPAIARNHPIRPRQKTLPKQFLFKILPL